MAGKATQWQLELEELDRRFAFTLYSDEQLATFQVLRANVKELGRHILGTCPEGRERALALTKLQEALLWASVAISKID